MDSTLKCICDRNPGVDLEFIEDIQPCTFAHLTERTEAVLQKYNEPVTEVKPGEFHPKDKVPGKRVRMVVVDAISSNPG